MRVIHFIGGEKGGVGKSVVARLLSQYFVDRKISHIGFDADRSHPTLTRHYDQFTRPIDLDYFESTDEIMELIAADDHQAIVDLPAQSQRFLDRWIEENGIVDMCAEMEIPLLFWYVIDDGADSAKLLASFLAQYGTDFRCVVVKNQGRGREFSEAERVSAAAAEAEHTQLIQATLPALHPETMRKIDKLSFSFWAAVNIKEGDAEHLSLMERQRAKVWLGKVYGMFDQIFAEIAPATTPSATE